LRIRSSLRCTAARRLRARSLPLRHRHGEGDCPVTYRPRVDCAMGIVLRPEVSGADPIKGPRGLGRLLDRNEGNGVLTIIVDETPARFASSCRSWASRSWPSAACGVERCFPIRKIPNDSSANGIGRSGLLLIVRLGLWSNVRADRNPHRRVPKFRNGFPADAFPRRR
jgi:hypothetical protein